MMRIRARKNPPQTRRGVQTINATRRMIFPTVPMDKALPRHGAIVYVVVPHVGRG